MKAKRVKQARSGGVSGRERGADRARPARRDALVRAGGARAGGDSSSTTCGSRPSGCATCSRRPASASAARPTTARRRARDLQDVLGELHDCDVMLPRIEAQHLGPAARGREVVCLRAGDATDLDPALVARAPNRTAYRGLEILAVYVQARRKLLFERFVESVGEIERSRDLDRSLSGRWSARSPRPVSVARPPSGPRPPSASSSRRARRARGRRPGPTRRRGARRREACSAVQAEPAEDVSPDRRSPGPSPGTVDPVPGTGQPRRR